MRKISVKKNQHGSHKQLDWLPIDSALIPNIISFGHVRGIARVFLIVELTLSCIVVFGTFITVIMHVFFSK